jgi:hypothetical protein
MASIFGPPSEFLFLFLSLGLCTLFVMSQERGKLYHGQHLDAENFAILVEVKEKSRS